MAGAEHGNTEADVGEGRMAASEGANGGEYADEGQDGRGKIVKKTPWFYVSFLWRLSLERSSINGKKSFSRCISWQLSKAPLPPVAKSSLLCDEKIFANVSDSVFFFRQATRNFSASRWKFNPSVFTWMWSKIVVASSSKLQRLVVKQ